MADASSDDHPQDGLATTAAQAFAPDSTATAAARPIARRAATADDPLLGHELAHFKLTHRIGAGGMGVVYRARDLSLDRDVAVKLLPREIASDPALRERFYREARAQARVRHPNVCHIYFVGEDRGQLFFAMELIEGQTVSDRLAREGRLALADAIDICVGVAHGLAAAHEHGFTHRDIKPSNVMVDANGVVRIVDFGLVTRGNDADGAVAGSAASKQADNTHATRAMMGTPLYMAPEQARGELVDFRADIYALGVMLHELVSGHTPFAGATLAELAAQHETEMRPPIRRAKRAPSNAAIADQLCERMMAKAPADRFDSYAALIRDLERASPRLSPPVRALTRWIATVIDIATLAFVWAVPVSILEALGTGELVPLHWLAFAATPVYFVVAWSRFGRTLGMSAFHLALVPLDRDGRATWQQAARRFVSTWRWCLLGLALAMAGALLRDVHMSGFVLDAALVITGVAGLVLGVVRVVVVGLWAGARGKRALTPWDRASRTEVVFQSTRPSLSQPV